MRSLIQMESRSSSSQVSTYRQRCSGSSLGKGQPPNPMPILMDIFFPLAALSIGLHLLRRGMARRMGYPLASASARRRSRAIQNWRS